MKGLLYKDSRTDALVVRPVGSDRDSDDALPLHYDDRDSYDHFEGELDVDYEIVSEHKMWGIKRYAKVASVVKPTSMKPEEKARELWWKYYNRIEHTLSEEYSPEETEIAKGLALIAVEEIIGLDIFECNCEWSDEDGDTREYWQEVKREIEKI